MTGCSQPGLICLQDHIYPRLRQPRATADGSSFRALAPCHDDSAHSLSISVGDHGRPVWHCFACTARLGKDAAQIRTRSYLIRAGVPARCLPMTREQVDSVLDNVRAILHADIGQAEKIYRLAALTECGGELPRGAELDELAGWCRISRRAAYNVTSRGREGHER